MSKTIIRAYVGSAEHLTEILNLNPTKEIDRINDYQRETMEFINNSILEPCDIARDLEDERERYMDDVQSQEDKWGEEK